jgi:hypothetical protein
MDKKQNRLGANQAVGTAKTVFMNGNNSNHIMTDTTLQDPSYGNHDPSFEFGALSSLAEQGAIFALPKGRTKGTDAQGAPTFEKGWQNNPHTLEEAMAHANSGGNVGILTGKYSSNIVALDRDKDFPETCALLGDLGQTAKIIRKNAPERGKFLYRIIDGDIPPTAMWKERPEDKHPACEFLGNGRHALCPPSEIDGAPYCLEDQHYGIKEVTPARMDYIWRLITGASIYKEQRAMEETQAGETSKDDYVQQVKGAWPTISIFQHFNKCPNGTERSGKDTRILGNGGLLVMPDNNQWFNQSDSVGGDNIDAWSYCKLGRKLDRSDKKMFFDIVNDMARAAGIEQPKARIKGTGKKGISPEVDPETGEIKSKADLWIDSLRSLPFTFQLNMLEDMVEVDGRRLDDVTRSKIHLEMASRDVSKTYVDDCINVVAAERTYHPVQDYLNGLEWDGQDHLEKMLQHIRGDDKIVSYPNGDTAQLHWLLIRRWLLGCVARALDGDKEHAFKHQTPMLVFVGKQGMGKSSWVRWLVSGVGYEFHRESPINPHNPEDIRSMVTKWIWEVSELGASLRKGDRDALKGFITQEWHTYRKPWGKASITKPTLCNFVGTVNLETGFLDDPTGHRRFLPIHVTAINRNYEKAVDINQLWAQVVHLYKKGETPELSKLERQALASIYEEHEVENPLQTYLQMYFEIDPGNTELKCFTANILSRLQEFNVSIVGNGKYAGREINDSLAPLGATRKKISIDGVKGWGWVGIAPNSRNAPR